MPPLHHHSEIGELNNMATKHDFAGEAARLGLTEERYRKLRRSLLACFHIRKDVPNEYRCFGGPFDGADIYLTTSSTGVIRLAEWHGVYKQTPTEYQHRSSGYHYQRAIYKCTWEQCNA